MIELIAFIIFVLIISWYGIKISIDECSFEIFPLKRFFTKNEVKLPIKNEQLNSDVQMGDFARCLEKQVGFRLSTDSEYHISDLVELYKKEILNINNTCPFCGSKNLFSFVLRHTKCRKCNQRWTD
jgi:hypothetical protein